MPGGERDSSKTRVAPVFDQLANRADDWVRALLLLARFGKGVIPREDVDLAYSAGFWGPRERGLRPPISLLSWLIRNLTPPTGTATVTTERRQLLFRDPKTIEAALRLLRNSDTDRGWWLFEGCTYPDVTIETPGAIVVIEGKRTEPGPTTWTTWMAARHQIWRHMDAAWEIRGGREVYGLFIVEGSSNDRAVPAVWQRAADEAMSGAALLGSFPHRSAAERDAIAAGFLGVATWQAVCQHFDIDYHGLPDRIPAAGVGSALENRE
jgi:hypothetical protein